MRIGRSSGRAKGSLRRDASSPASLGPAGVEVRAEPPPLEVPEDRLALLEVWERTDARHLGGGVVASSLPVEHVGELHAELRVVRAAFE